MLFTGKEPIALQDHYWTNRWVSRVIGITSIHPLWLWNVLLRVEGCSLADTCGSRTRVVTCADNVVLHFVASSSVKTPFFEKSEYVCNSVEVWPLIAQTSLSWEINEAHVEKKKDVEGRRWRREWGADSHRIVHICVNRLCFVTLFFFTMLSDEIRRHKCRCVPNTYTGSSHASN